MSVAAARDGAVIVDLARLGAPCRQPKPGADEERSGTLLNRTRYPSDVIARCGRARGLWRLRYKLSLRDLPEMFAVRGIVFSYEAVREWKAGLTPALAEDLRRRRRGKVGAAGSWMSVPDGARALVLSVSRHRPERELGRRAVQRTPRHGSGPGVLSVRKGGDRRDAGPGHDRWSRRLPRAMHTEFGKGVWRRTSAYLNNRLEQDHRASKAATDRCGASNARRSAARFCRAYDDAQLLPPPLPPCMCPPTAADCFTSGGPRPCWPSRKPHDPGCRRTSVSTGYTCWRECLQNPVIRWKLWAAVSRPACGLSRAVSTPR